MGMAGEVYSAHKASNEATKEDSFVPMAPDVMKLTSDILENHSKNLEKSAELLKKLNALADKVYKIFKSVYTNEKEVAKVEKILQYYSQNYSKNIKMANKMIKNTKIFKTGSKLLKYGATPAAVGIQIHDYINSERNQVDTINLEANRSK